MARAIDAYMALFPKRHGQNCKNPIEMRFNMHVAAEFFQKEKKNDGKFKRIIENDKM